MSVKTMINRGCLFVAFLLAQSAFADVNDAVCHVEAKNAAESRRSAGDGVCVSVKDKIALVLTCDHIVRSSETKQLFTEVKVTFPSRKRYKAEIVYTDYDDDLTVLRIHCSDETPCVTVGKESQEGDSVTVIGDSSSVDEPIRTGRVIAPIKQTRHRDFQLDVVIHSGDSGGGVFNSDNHLVGIVSGHWDDRHLAVGPGVRAIKKALDAVRKL